MYILFDSAISFTEIYPTGNNSTHVYRSVYKIIAALFLVTKTKQPKRSSAEDPS